MIFHICLLLEFCDPLQRTFNVIVCHPPHKRKYIMHTVGFFVKRETLIKYLLLLKKNKDFIRSIPFIFRTIPNRREQHVLKFNIFTTTVFTFIAVSYFARLEFTFGTLVLTPTPLCITFLQASSSFGISAILHGQSQRVLTSVVLPISVGIFDDRAASLVNGSRRETSSARK